MVDLRRSMTDFQKITHQAQGMTANLFFDIVYGPAVRDAELTRARFHVIAVTPVDATTGDRWRVYQIDYYNPPDADEPWPSVHFGPRL